MRLKHKVYVNADDALIVWTADSLDDRLHGFAIQRKRNAGSAEFVSSFRPSESDDHQLGEFERSDEAPIRAFSWTDHGVEPGDTVSYRVVPVFWGKGAMPSRGSRWSAARAVRSAEPGSPYMPYFNRGFVISQFVSRHLEDAYPRMTRVAALRAFKESIGDEAEVEWRDKLAGHLRTAMLDLLDSVISGDEEIYAALYELGDRQLIGRLTQLGKRAHVVLSNGSVEVKGGDQNKAARKMLKDAKVETLPRFLSPGGLGHNKFLVVTSAAGEARKVWTGSTNWTPTGLCTQINNGLLIEDPVVAEHYLEQWKALSTAGDEFPEPLLAANAQPASFGGDKPGTSRVSVHFSRVRKRVDLNALAEIIKATESGLLFLLFNSGNAGVIPAIKDLAEAKPQVLVRGVATQLPQPDKPRGSKEKVPLKTTLFGNPAADHPETRTFDVVLPTGHEHTVARWAVESQRGQFMSGVGPAIIHSKVLVVDPFSKDPVVVTGSHNFSSNASTKNDENFIVLRGDRAVAEAYAVNIQSAWRHYSSRIGTAHAASHPREYLQKLLDDRRRDETFWGLG